jgi:type II secretory ATPase GspE/PulE/Tfp pilus assembly ATPase PilB-like protein
MTKKKDPIRPLHPDLTPQFKKLTGSYSATDEAEPGEWFEALLADARSQRASDLHLDPAADGYVLRLRVDGALYDVCAIPRDLAERILNHFKVAAQLDPVPALRPMEGWVEHNAGDTRINLRISCVPSVAGDKLSIRILDPKRLRSTMTDLGLNPEQSELVRSWVGDIQGMLLVAGPVGTGKTTTLYSLLEELKPRDRSVVTIEDPVEFRIDGITQMQVLPKQDFNFTTALKTILRLDPDYIMVGEIRDTASTEAAWDAASTGKILFSTLHSRDAAGVVTTLRNLGREDFEIASMLELVVAQRLVRTLCEDCKKEKAPESIDRKWLESINREVPEKACYAEGCSSCGGVGYVGRTGIFEVWRLKDKDKEFIVGHPDELSLRDRLRKQGVPSLLDSAMDLVESGRASLTEVRALGGIAR